MSSAHLPSTSTQLSQLPRSLPDGLPMADGPNGRMVPPTPPPLSHTWPSPSTAHPESSPQASLTILPATLVVAPCYTLPHCRLVATSSIPVTRVSIGIGGWADLISTKDSRPRILCRECTVSLFLGFDNTSSDALSVSGWRWQCSMVA